MTTTCRGLSYVNRVFKMTKGKGLGCKPGVRWTGVEVNLEKKRNQRN